MWVVNNTLYFTWEWILYLWVYTVLLIGFSYELGNSNRKKKKWDCFVEYFSSIPMTRITLKDTGHTQSSAYLTHSRELHTWKRVYYTVYSPILFPFTTSSWIIRSFAKLVESNRHGEEIDKYISIELVRKLLRDRKMSEKQRIWWVDQ